MHRLWKTLWTECGGPALCCGSQPSAEESVVMVATGGTGRRPGSTARATDVRGSGGGPATDRVPARAKPGRDLQGQGVPGRGGHDPAARRRGRRSGCRAGTLRELPGIGASTAEVIEAAVEGRMPRPAGEARARGRRSAGRRAARTVRARAARRPALPQRLVRRRIADRGDGLHRHRARSRLPRAHRPLAPPHGGQRPLGGAPDPPARGGRGGQRAPRLGGGFRLLKGIEVDILDDGSLDQTEEMLARLDVRVASVHSKLAMDTGADDPADGGCGAQPVRQRARPLHRAAGDRQPGHARAVGVRRRGRCSARALETGTAVEINSRPERRDPPTKLLQQAIDMGCLFSIDSDAHAPGPAGLPGLRV